MAYTSYRPDPDLDEDEDSFGYGYFVDENGQERYGWDPIEARRLIDTAPPAPPPIAAPVDQRTAQMSDPDEYATMIARETGGAPLVPGQAALQANAPRADVAPPVPGMGEPEDDDGLSVEIPKSSRIASVHNNPGNLMYANQQGATKGEAKEGGGNWAKFETPEAGYNALKRQIALDSARGHTLGSFIGKYAPEFENNVAAYTKNVEGFTGARADTPLTEIDSEKLARAMARQESSTRVSGQGEPYVPGGSPGVSPAAAAAPPGAMPSGMVPAQTTVRGVPLTPQQIEDEQRRVMNQTFQQMGAEQIAARARLEGRREAMTAVEQHSQAMERDQQAQAMLHQTAAQKAKQKLDEEFRRPVEQVDPKRYIKNMSVGERVMGALAMLISAVGQGLASRAGIRMGNMAMEYLDQSIADDIASQKDALDRGERASQNRVAHWTRVMNNEEQGAQLATAEAYQVAARRAEYLAKQKVENADIAAAGMQKSAEIAAKGQQLAADVEAQERDRLVTVFQPPKPVPVSVVGSEVAPVGVEDQDPETRAALANQFNSENPAHKGQLNTLTKEMEQVTKLEQTVNRMEQVYGVQADAQGNYPEDAPNYDSSATGMDPFEAMSETSEQHGRARKLRDLWSQVELDTRMGWVTEPNGETKQVELSGIQKPMLDRDVPTKLRELREEMERRRRAIMSGTLAPVRAAWKLQNQFPIGGGVQINPVSGMTTR